MTKIIATYRIPYDIDIFWDGGCGGRDLVPDSFGDEVRLLISDSGTAYVCPENTEGKWRIYIDSCGFERQFRMMPREKKEDELGRRFINQPSFYDVLACGLSMNPGILSHVERVGECNGDGGHGRLPTVFEGLNFKVGERTLVFEDGIVMLKEPHTGCWSTDYWINGDGIARAKRWEEKEDGEGYYWTERVTMATAEEFHSAVEFLKKEIAFTNGIQKQAVRMAIGAFERTARMMDETEAFEKACGKGG